MPNFKNKPRWFKRVVKPGYQALQFLRGIKPDYQLKTAPLRKLPDFLIIGAQRAGTTSLFHYLSQHPQIIPAIRKEIHFFDSGKNPQVNNFEQGELWYRSHFPMRSRSGNNKITFEATPMYLFHPEAPGRIHAMVPQTKVIVLLRNPVERAISHYFSEYKKGMEDLPMLEAFQREEQRLEAVLAGRDYKHPAFFHHTYKARGRYLEQLQRYKEYFPAERILILQSEIFYTRPAEILRTIFKFLNVNPEQRIRNLRKLNASEGKSIIERNVYDYLYAYFKPYNEALYEFIGRRYDWKPN